MLCKVGTLKTTSTKHTSLKELFFAHAVEIPVSLQMGFILHWVFYCVSNNLKSENCVFFFSFSLRVSFLELKKKIPSTVVLEADYNDWKTLSVIYSKLYFIEKQDVDFINNKTSNLILKKNTPTTITTTIKKQRRQDGELSGS